MLPSIPSALPGQRPTSVPPDEARRDRELMRRVIANDTGAFSALYDRHVQRVYGLAYRILHERSAAEDATQEAFITLWRNRHSYRPERGSPGSWLRTITRNRAIDVIRRDRVHLYAELETDRDQEAPERTDEQALQRLEAVTIDIALQTLPDAQRQALELSYFGGFSHPEIAARLGVPLGTIKGRMRLGLRKLATQLGPQAAAASERHADPARSSPALN